MTFAGLMQNVRGAVARSGCALFVACAGLAQAADNGVKAGTAPLPPVQVEPLAGGGLAKIGFGLLIVVALIVALSWGMRRMGGLVGAGAGALRILGGLSVGTRERVVLIQVGDQQLLLGVAPGSVKTLHVLEEPIPTTSSTGSGKSGFAANLSAALQRGKKS